MASLAEHFEPPEEREALPVLPDYLPARMVNEFVYCPRLFFYEWVEGLFRDSVDTIEGRHQHRRLEARSDPLPAPDQVGEEKIHSRSVTLSSDQYRVIARMDLIEGQEGTVSPVDYKHGSPRESEDQITVWPADRAQLAVQALILRENGYRCEEGTIYYAKTKQRVRILIDDALLAETVQILATSRALAQSGQIPPPLVDSPKCPKCSMVGICLPDETNALLRRAASSSETESLQQLKLFFPLDGPPRKPAGTEVRQLVAARDDLRPLYLNSQGTRVGKTGEVLRVKEKDQLLQEVRLGEISQVNLFGNVQLSTQAIQTLCEAEIPICYFSQGGWFYGITSGLNVRNILLRRDQFRLADKDWFVLSLSRKLVAGKIRNQRTLLQRNHMEPPAEALRMLKLLAQKAETAQSTGELLGIEGTAARVYFEHFVGMLKREDEDPPADKEPDAGPAFKFHFAHRNRRPPRDPVNALLSLAYSMLTKDLTIACLSIGFDPYLGFYHLPRFGRPALALDLLEPFRPLIADSAVLSAINTRMVQEKEFVQAGPAVALTPAGRKGFFHAYELRMDTLVTHPLFDYRVSYRRLLEIQARLLARLINGEIEDYPVFVTR